MSESKKTRTRHNLIHNVTWAMCAGLPNVKVNAADTVINHDTLRKILFNAALEHRDWTFKTLDTRIFIYHGEERLASVEVQWSSRASTYIPHLNAHRLGRRRSGDTVFSNAEAAPILRKIREAVYPRTDEEAYDEVAGDVSGALHTPMYYADKAVDSADAALSEAAVAFAMSPQFKAQFIQYEATFGVAAKRDTAKTLETRDEAVEKRDTIQHFRRVAGGDVAVVAVTPQGWYVKYKDAVTKYPADELPEQFRNMNILKMVERNVPVRNIGIKVSDQTFIVVVSEE